MYRLVDFGQEHLGQKGKVLSIEYDPYRNAFIALIHYEDGKKGYILCPQDVKAGDEIVCEDKAEVKPGNRMRLENIPIGTMVYNIELDPGRGGKLVRGAGVGARVLALEGGYVHLQLPSTEIRKVSSECFASIGMVSNPGFMYEKDRKAGTTRWKGRRPSVRGTAMNPVDHPHGGGEGRQPRGMHPKTPWGKPAFGVKTRNKKKWSTKLIVQRRAKKKKTA
jgi:large subunit ribosomal protein L2